MSEKFHFRFIETDQTRAGDSDRTVTVTFSSEEPVERREYIEILSHKEGDYDLHKLTDGGAVLYNHDANQQIGVVERAWVEARGGRRVGRALIRFSRNQFADEVFQDIKDCIRSKISFGYSIDKTLKNTRNAEGQMVCRFSWTGYEISIVPTPADNTVGVDRSFEIGSEELATRGNMKTLSPFDRLTQAMIGEQSKAPAIGATVRALIDGKITPEIEDENYRLASSMKHLPGSGLGVSGSTFYSFRAAQRDLQVGVFSQGGALIGDDALPIASPLMNQTIAEKGGSRIITGLSNACFLPRWTSMPTATNLAEMATAPDSTPGTDQVHTRPHRISVTCILDRQLELLSPNIGQSLTRLIFKALALKVDENFLYGQGTIEPLGILNTPGIGSVIFGGPANAAQVIALETALTDSNVECDPATTWYFTSPQSKSKLKQVAKSANITQPIWDTVAGVDYCNGYRAMASKQVLNNQLGLVDFSETALCIYGDGIEFVYNPFSLDISAKIRITANIWIDVLVDHAAAIACSADAANQ